MSTKLTKTLDIATIFFRPYETLEQAPEECSLCQAYFNVTSLMGYTPSHLTKLNNRINAFLKQCQTEHEDAAPAYPQPGQTTSTRRTDADASPATKAILYLMTFARNFHPLVFKLHPPDQKRSPYHSFSIQLITAHIPGSPQKPGRPRQLVKANRILREVLWHAIRQHETNTGLNHQGSSPCGVVGCDSACCPESKEEERLKFHLDRVYQHQTASKRARRISLDLSHPHTHRKKQRKHDFLSLPEEVVLRIASSLPPPDLARLSACNPYLERTLLHVVPGLRLNLFPHQIHALKRMYSMEALTVRDTPMPLLFPIKIPNYAAGCSLAVDLVDGSILFVDGIPCTGPPSGGLFCDEPGLGKTVTAIALVLKTMGRYARPPVGKIVLNHSVDSKQHDIQPIYANINGNLERLKEEDIASDSSSDDDFNENAPYFVERPVSRFRACGEDLLVVRPRRSKLLVDDFDRASAPRRSVRHTDFLGRGQSLGVPSAESQETHVYLSRATLVVVPIVLINHWVYQLFLHVEEGYLRILHVRDKIDVPESARRLANDYDVIIVAFDVVRDMYESMRDTVPSLMQVHFRRIIVDEGHALSASNSFSNFSSVCQRLRAECRWVMTGTPTPSTPRSDVDHLFELLSFIREEGYGLDKDAWKVGISEPYSQFKRESLERLGVILSRVMIRADKSILRANCHIKDVLLEFSDASAKSYNDIVRMVHRNLFLCDWFSESHRESLINPANHYLAREVFRNLKLACCAGGSALVEFYQHDVIETLDELYLKYREIAGIRETDRFRDPTFDTALLDACSEGKPEVELKKEQVLKCQELHHSLLERGEGFIRLPRYKSDSDKDKTDKEKAEEKASKYEKAIYAGRLHQIAESLLSGSTTCERCCRETAVPIVTPCGHLLCDDCILKSKTNCTKPGCGYAYELDRKGIPENLIELQPSVSAEKWVKNWADTKSAKVDYLIDRIIALPDNEIWEEGKLKPIIRKPKVIVHSEYKEHLNFVAVKMQQNPALATSYIEMTRNEMEEVDNIRHQRSSDVAVLSLEKFKSYEPDEYGCTHNILLMNSRHGAVGLDLSFVQYIFLLEPVWDRANELQIISRAHRIGCRQDIYVERLVMRDSVEHSMLIESRQRTASSMIRSAGNEKFRTAELEVTGVAKDRLAQDRKRRVSILRSLKTVKGVSELAEPDQGDTSAIPKEGSSCETALEEIQPAAAATTNKRNLDQNEGERKKKRVCFQL